MRFWRRRDILVLLPVLLSGAPTWAQMLNSERIEQTFGSYGIDVVFSDDSLRISNLYSRHTDRKITRTLAFVGYPESIEPAIADIHQAILDGGSIGATFTAAGWAVEKSGHSYFRVGPPAAVLDGMSIATSEPPLAAHVYGLTVARAGQRIDYAQIIEIHHPDYLDEADLETIYGPEEIVGMLESTRRLLERGTKLFTDHGLSLSQ